MNENAWLRQVLANAKTAKESWPAWAKTSIDSMQTALNSHPNQEMRPAASRKRSRSVKKDNQSDLGLK
jgi:hypothetical protein